MENRNTETPLERAERVITNSTPDPKDFGRIYDADDKAADHSRHNNIHKQF